jgi:hypothetical protein
MQPFACTREANGRSADLNPRRPTCGKEPVGLMAAGVGDAHTDCAQMGYAGSAHSSWIFHG